MKKILVILSLILTSLMVYASDLVIESKTQVFSNKEKKIKLDGDVKVKLDDLTVESPRAEVSIRRGNKLDTATFYDKPYAYEVNENKKREVKANILQVSLINKIVRAEGETQSIISEGNTPIVIINADEQEYDTKSNVMVANGHVKIWFDDYYAQGPKVSVFPDLNTGKPNDVYFIGRSKIIQEDKDIIADKIHLTLDPKDFQAEGNVRTIIHNIETKKDENL